MPYSVFLFFSSLQKKKVTCCQNSFWKPELFASLLHIKDLGVRSISSLSCYLWSSYYSWNCSQIPKASCILAQIKCRKISSAKCVIFFLFLFLTFQPFTPTSEITVCQITEVRSQKTLWESKETKPEVTWKTLKQPAAWEVMLENAYRKTKFSDKPFAEQKEYRICDKF